MTIYADFTSKSMDVKIDDFRNFSLYSKAKNDENRQFWRHHFGVILGRPKLISSDDDFTPDLAYWVTSEAWMMTIHARNMTQ